MYPCLATEKFTVGGARVAWGIAHVTRALLVQQTRDTFRERSPRDDWTLEPRTVRVRVKFFHDPFRFCSGFLGCMDVILSLFFCIVYPWLLLFPATLNIGEDMYTYVCVCVCVHDGVWGSRVLCVCMNLFLFAHYSLCTPLTCEIFETYVCVHWSRPGGCEVWWWCRIHRGGGGVTTKGRRRWRGCAWQ